MRITIFIAASLVLAGCTSWQQTAYNTTQAYQQNQCQKIMDNIERQHCLRKADTSYDDYKRQTESSAK